MQRRLKPAEIVQLLAAHAAGDLVRDIAARFGVSRTTVLGHATRRALPRRSDNGWSHDELRTAANLYADGHSLAVVGQRFGVHAAGGPPGYVVSPRGRNPEHMMRNQEIWSPSVT
jgi:hypothetical protein